MCWSIALIPTIVNLDKIYTTEGLLVVIWASISLTLCAVILIFDRIKCLNDIFNIREKGNVEGFLLSFIVLFWIGGVSIITRANGIAYSAMNIYVMVWGNLFASIYSLNQWLTSKDIISIQMLIRLSPTLSGWYSLLFASLVLTFSSVNLVFVIEKNSCFLSECIFAVIAGAISMCVSIVSIFLHYRIISCLGDKGRGFLEIGFSILCIILWLIGVGTLTSGNSIAPTIVGTQSCTCSDGIEKAPGSNLYLGTWGCFLSSCYITFKWNKVQAMNLATIKGKATASPEVREDNDDI